MSWGAALYRLLGRPATVAWIPLAGLASFTATVFGMSVWELFMDTYYRGPQASATAILVFPALIGLLVGQAVKELQHCHLAWMLPALRRRLLPGVVLVGLTVALGSREILTALVAPFMLFDGRPVMAVWWVWEGYPELSAGLVALCFMAFWIGVRPSFWTWLFVIGPLVVLSTVLVEFVAEIPFVVIVATTPLTAFLVYRTFSVGSARRRPFVRTHSLSGDGRRRGEQRRPWTIGRSEGIAWQPEYLGADVSNWIRAGAYENHGFHNRFVVTAALATPVLAAAYLILGLLVMSTDRRGPSIWTYPGVHASFAPGFGWSVLALSTFAAVPLAVLLVCYGSISLTRRPAYPLSRQQAARVEAWSGLAENLLVCGFLAALLVAYWGFLFGGLGFEGWEAWPERAGGRYGWIPFLLRALGIVFALLPIAQVYRLRVVRAPNGWSSLRMMINVVALMIVLTIVALLAGDQAMTTFPQVFVFGDVALILAFGFLIHMGYRYMVGRYFATADLV